VDDAKNQIEWWDSNFQPANSPNFDFIDRSGSVLIAIKSSPQGFRGLHDGLIGIASALREHETAKWGCLVLDASRMTVEKTKSKWNQLKLLFTDDISKRLAIIIIRNSKTWVIPEDSFLTMVANSISVHPKLKFCQLRQSRRLPPHDKQLEVIKVIILRWLKDQGPIGVGELGSQAGCSYPTVKSALYELSKSNLLNDAIRPAVELNRLSEKLWNKVMTLSTTKRTQIKFFDRSGQPADPIGLLKRLKRLSLRNVALGGVVAARHWHPNFDLNGTPRIDLLIHCPNQQLDLDFIAQLDPALEESTNQNQSAILVIHTLARANADFVYSSELGCHIADPLETALDLIDLGLTQQANNLMAHFRKEIRIV